MASSYKGIFSVQALPRSQRRRHEWLSGSARSEQSERALLSEAIMTTPQANGTDPNRRDSLQELQWLRIEIRIANLLNHATIQPIGDRRKHQTSQHVIQTRFGQIQFSPIQPVLRI